MKLFIHKIFNWEYWPYQIVYIPIYFVWLYYSIKSKSLFFFNEANPSIKNGGFFNESKFSIYKLIPQIYYPKTILVNSYSKDDVVLELVKNNGISFPLIVKPDLGLRGTAVKKIYNTKDLIGYNATAKFNYLVQELIPYSKEVGIFYIRYPNKNKGKITGIVSKEFLTVKGDGQKTLKQLILENPRYAMQYHSLKKEYENELNTVIKKSETINLVPIGNHARGAKFIDFTCLIDDQLTNTIDTLCQQINGFYYGRLDIMYDNWEDLLLGKNYMIVEVNGAASEPTHIYDPKHSILFAWREIIKHIGILYKISYLNRKNNIKKLSFKDGLKELKLHNSNFKLLKEI